MSTGTLWDPATHFLLPSLVRKNINVFSSLYYENTPPLKFNIGLLQFHNIPGQSGFGKPTERGAFLYLGEPQISPLLLSMALLLSPKLEVTYLKPFSYT